MAHYEYDAWGNVLSVTDQNGNAITSATHIGNLNPFRYHGYYLDTETGLYYLMSRYYDPVVHRFINADGYFQAGGSILDANMSAYCGNNPVSPSDPTGEMYEQYGAAGGGFYVSGGGYGGGSFSSSGSSVLIAAGVAILASETYREAKREHILTKNLSKSSSNSTVSTPSSSDSYCVYGLRDEETDSIKYVGRTKNLVARKNFHQHDVQHGRDKLVLEILNDNLTLSEARGLEQAYMLHYHTLRKGDYPYNQINGIRWDNPSKEEYVIDAKGYLDNVISNELLNWAGI